jgi:anti-sigma regulatory factor (Ser/Thr protein kinase)
MARGEEVGMCLSTARAECELPLEDSSPARARQFLRGATCAEHAGHVLEDAVLLVSEVVTNSVVHGGPPIIVAVDCESTTGLRVRVRDGNSALPKPRVAELWEEGGRGLSLLERLSADWGVDPEPGDGKEVWFVLR